MTKHWTWQSFSSVLSVGHKHIEFIAKAATDGAGLGAMISTSAGDRVTSVGVRLQGTGAPQTCELFLIKQDASGARTLLAESQIIDPHATLQEYAQQLDEPYEVREGEMLTIAVRLPLAGTCVASVGHAKLVESESEAA